MYLCTETDSLTRVRPEGTYHPRTLTWKNRLARQKIRKRGRKSNIYLVLFDAEWTYCLFDNAAAHEGLVRVVCLTETDSILVRGWILKGRHTSANTQAVREQTESEKQLPIDVAVDSEYWYGRWGEKQRREGLCSQRWGVLTLMVEVGWRMPFGWSTTAVELASMDALKQPCRGKDLQDLLQGDIEKPSKAKGDVVVRIEMHATSYGATPKEAFVDMQRGAIEPRRGGKAGTQSEYHLSRTSAPRAKDLDTSLAGQRHVRVMGGLQGLPEDCSW